MSGATIDFSAADLDAAASAYNPAIYQAPIVVGHPSVDAPAYGWVAGLAAEAGDLYALPDQVEAQFADLVSEGRYKKVSASWFPPTHPRNPVPGVFYLKHLGFLGATAPAVSGLKPVEFSDDDAACVTVEFAMADGWTVKNLFRRLREWFIAEKGLETADQVIPEWSIDGVQVETESTAPNPMFATPNTDEGDAMSDAEKARLAELEAQAAALAAENAALKSQSAEFADREAALAAREAEARAAEIAEFADGLVKAGKVLPRDKAGLVAYLSADGSANAIEFADAEGATVTKPADAWLREFLTALPVQVDFAERGAPEGDTPAAAEFAAPEGYAVDPGSMDVHRRAVAYQAANAGTDYLAAVKAVSANH